MNASRRWLEAFLRTPLESKDVARRLGMLGAAVDAIEPLHASLAPFKVGLVLEVRPHSNPKVTKVRVTQVDDGSGTPIQVFCGAPNVTVGRKYPLAPLGTRMQDGRLIEARDLRGEMSYGMLCSAVELGLGTESDGILELDTDAPPGTPLLEVLDVEDDRLVVDVTANRPDLLCHKGLARELATSLGVPFRLPALPGAAPAEIPPAVRVHGEREGRVANVRIGIDDVEGCRRFHAAVIRGVRIGPSPAWMQQRLEAAGVRAISNVVDVTNYVMLELNQPMHAYDLGRLQGPELRVRRARAGESIETLDGTGRALRDDMTVIGDAAQVVGVAGVMGGASSEVGAATTDLLLEAAWWQPSGIRRTRRALNLSTEASYRFERGIDLWGGADAMRRAIELVLLTAGGTLDGAPLDLWPEPSHPPRIFLRMARLAQVIGIELPLREVERCLVAIGCTVVAKPDDGRLAVDVPGWRPDLREEVDLVEEVARIHGYDNIPDTLRPFRMGARAEDAGELAEGRIRRGMAAQGLHEAMSLPLTTADGDDSVRLENPLSADHGALRRTLLPGLVAQVERNWSARVRDVRLFEVGTVFRAGPAGGRPHEERRLAAVITGAREPAHWGTPAADADLWDAKAIFEAAVALALPGAAVQVASDELVAIDPAGRVVGRVTPLAADAPPWAAPLFGLELRIDASVRPAPRFQGLPTTPAADRDLALVLRDGVGAAQVQAVVRTAAGPLLESLAVLSEYRGQGVPAGHRSLAIRLVFRAADRTLTDAEVDEREGAILVALRTELGAERRGAGAA